jgi:long-chain acyl-CoA synthetase
MKHVEFTTIPATFRRVAQRMGAKPAIHYLGTPFSYQRLDQLTDRFAAGLAARGIGQGERVVLYLPNSVQWAIAWLGVLKAGCVAVPITPIYTPYDLSYIANDTRAAAVVCTDRNYGYVDRVMDETELKLAVVSNLADILPWPKRLVGWLFDKVPRGRAAQGGQAVWLTDLVKEAEGAAPAIAEDPDAVAEVLYTGGTTKHPKGVPITHRLLLACCHEQLSTPAALFAPEENVLLGSAPMFHVLGQTCGLGTILVHGGTMVLQPRVNLDAMFDAIQRYGVKTLIGVPALYRMILEHDRLDQYDLGSLRYCFCGGDVLPTEVAKRWRRRFDKPIYIGYGSTETVGGVSMCPPGEEMPEGTMGKVLASKQVLVAEPASLRPAEPDRPGELLVHSEPMVEAYWNKPEETGKAFVDIQGQRYYRTADVVRMDERGYLFFVDRTVDTIKHKGYRVSASEIESVLQEHPAVISSCVVGIPDPKVGERIKAFVVLKKDVKGITGYDLISHCKGRLAGYKIPQYIEFRDMLPKSKVGKLLRREVRDEEQSRMKT